jgi:hypothetical protein
VVPDRRAQVFELASRSAYMASTAMPDVHIARRLVHVGQGLVLEEFQQAI